MRFVLVGGNTNTARTDGIGAAGASLEAMLHMPSADVVTFAPTAGDELPDCDGVYLPGGYPELHADSLETSPAIGQLGAEAADGLPILGECGGLMTLAETLTTAAGDTHHMASVLPADVRMHERYQALDHVELGPERDRSLPARGRHSVATSFTTPVPT